MQGVPRVEHTLINWQRRMQTTRAADTLPVPCRQTRPRNTRIQHLNHRVNLSQSVRQRLAASYAQVEAVREFGTAAADHLDSDAVAIADVKRANVSQAPSQSSVQKGPLKS